MGLPELKMRYAYQKTRVGDTIFWREPMGVIGSAEVREKGALGFIAIEGGFIIHATDITAIHRPDGTFVA